MRCANPWLDSLAMAALSASNDAQTFGLRMRLRRVPRSAVPAEPAAAIWTLWHAREGRQESSVREAREAPARVAPCSQRAEMHGASAGGRAAWSPGRVVCAFVSWVSCREWTALSRMDRVRPVGLRRVYPGYLQTTVSQPDLLSFFSCIFSPMIS